MVPKFRTTFFSGMRYEFNFSWNYILFCGTFPISLTKHFALLRGKAQVFLNSATMDLRSSTEWPNLLQLRDTPSALQQKMTWVWGRCINSLDYFPDGAITLVHFVCHCFFHSLSPFMCMYMCCISHSVSAVSSSHSFPFSVSLPSPASSVKWWTCSPHAVCHCHPSLQSWRWRESPGCVWNGRGPVALRKKTTSTIFWKWKRRARYVSV